MLPNMKKAICAIVMALVTVSSVHSHINLPDPETDQGGRCGGTLESDSGTLIFPAAGQEIQAGEICIWTIHLQTKNSFRLNFSSIDVTGNNEDCLDGAVRLYSLTNLIPSQRAESYTFCNQSPPPTSGSFFLSENLVTVTYYSTKNGTNAGTGFTLNWEGSSFQPLPKIHESTYTSAPSGVIRYPFDGEYPPNRVTTWLVKTARSDASSDEGLHLTFSDINMESCSASLEDPCLCDALILYEITNDGHVLEKSRLCGNTTGADIQGLGDNFILALFTDHQDVPSEGTGFELVYRPVSSEGTTPPPTTSAPPTANYSNTCGEILVGDRGLIEYQLDQPYKNFERCLWTVRSPYHGGIRFTINKMEFEQRLDFIAVYKVNNTGIYEFERFAVGSSLVSFVVWSTVAIVSFYSDVSVVGKGFSMSFEADDWPEYNVKYWQDVNLVANSYSPPESLIYPTEDTGAIRDFELSTFVITRNSLLADVKMDFNITSLSLEVGEDGQSCKDVMHVFYMYPRNTVLRRLSPEAGICQLSQFEISPTLLMDALLIVISTDGEGHSQSDGFQVEYNLRL